MPGQFDNQQTVAVCLSYPHPPVKNATCVERCRFHAAYLLFLFLVLLKSHSSDSK